MFQFDYNTTDYEQLLLKLAAQLNVPAHNNQVIFPTSVGDGDFLFLPLPNGLHACIINCTFNQDWLIHRKRNHDGEYYTLRFDELSIPGTLAVTIDEDKLREKNTSKSIAYLTSSYFDWSYLGTQGGHYFSIAILLNKEFLAKYIDTHTVEDVLSTYISLKAENFNIEPLDSKYRQWMRTILEVGDDNPLRLTVIQNRIMLMIERFFTHLYDKMKNPTFRIPLSQEDINRVMKIESVLTKDIFQPAPSIQQLARMVSISESKLKKDFKTMYGFPIYEYYQKARMQAAQDKLLTRKFSVKEVAMELGYANLSNFTIAFKKEFGVLPSQLLS